MGVSYSKKSSILPLEISLGFLTSMCQENEIISKKLRLIEVLHKIKL